MHHSCLIFLTNACFDGDRIIGPAFKIHFWFVYMVSFILIC